MKASTSTVSTENEAAEELRLLGEILSRKILPWAPLDGLQPTPIEGLELIRCLVSSVHLPVLGQVTQASPDKPYLGVKLSVDPQEVTDLIIELGDDLSEPEEECPDISCGLCRTQAEKGMVEAVTRLVSLLDSPADARILAPLARREIIYRALIGETGPRMRRFASADSQAHRISKVIAVLKDRFTEPLQFQKKLRLHEARRLMLSEGLEAATASFRVGYESPSHFSREYSRLFGAPPRADVIKLRDETPQAVRL